MSAGVSPVRPAQSMVTEPSTAPSESPTLLPDAPSLGMSGIDDALGALYMSMAQQQLNTLQVGSTRVKVAEQEQKKDLADQQAAEQREQANAANHGRGFFSSIGHLAGDVTGDLTHLRPIKAVEDGASDANQAVHSPAFWNDLEQGALVVSKVAAVVGSAVLTTASFGAGAGSIVLVALALSASGEVVSDTGCLGKDSGVVGAGLEVAGAVTGLVGGLAMPTNVTGAARIGMGVGAAFTGLGGEAETVAGGAHVVNQDFAANVQSASADAQQAVDRSSELEQTIAWVLDDLKAAGKSGQSAKQSLQGAIENNDQSTAAASASVAVRG